MRLWRWCLVRLVMGWTWAAELGLTLRAVVAVSTVARPGHVLTLRGVVVRYSTCREYTRK